MIRERRKERDRDAEDEEEAYERRKLEKKLREKEAAYQEVNIFYSQKLFRCNLFVHVCYEMK